MSSKNICPVCGYDKLTEPPYDLLGYPSYEICSCCGFEYGFDDGSEGKTFEVYRAEWISNGYPFYVVSAKPADWGDTEIQNQLKNIEKVNYHPKI